MDAREDPTAAESSAGQRPETNRPPCFPSVPVGWYHLSRGRDVRPGPVRCDVGGRPYVGFRDAAGRPAALDGACSHMKAGLGYGEVVGGRIRCPLHGWEYDRDGRCARIPAGGPIPPFAVQASYPTAEVGPEVAFCNAPAAPFPFPFFDGVGPDDLLAADPFEFDVNVPWYMIGANAFDLQHFRTAHDRTLVGDPVVDSPAPFARRIAADFDVTGTSWRDQLTRRFSGPRVRMTVTSWAGTVVLVTAAFRRTTSYGMVLVRPIPAAATRPGGNGDGGGAAASPGRSLVRVVVWVPRRRSRVARAVLDPVDAAVRRAFIRAFLRPDVMASDGVRYTPGTLIDADRELAAYLRWLSAACGGDGGGSDGGIGSV